MIKTVDTRSLVMAAVAGIVLGACKGGGDSSSSASPVSTGAASAVPVQHGEKACCKGLNDCKTKGGCAVDGKHECAGKNDCKGQGGCNMNCKK